jgi:hypothetical protein
MLAVELNKVFKEDEKNPNVSLLMNCLRKFCLERKYD